MSYMPCLRRGLLFLTLATLLGSVPSAWADPVQLNFDRTIASLLMRRCLDCHSGPKPKGDLDLSRRKPALKAVTPGKPEDSALYQRVRDNEMPPKKPLPEAERKLLRDWIAGGAVWGSDPIDPFRLTTDHRAGQDWWSLQPVQRPSLPSSRTSGWVRNPIDAFILTRLEKANLSPAPEANRRTLIRRLSFDLLGLPPSPEEIDAFVRDPAADAYERLVDRLLASPHYGERWARHWLDVVRFGESNGFERDLPRFNAWPYRDWVVSALNRDLGYDDFVRLQLAGDLLEPTSPEAIKATGFLAAGPHDTVVPVSPNMQTAMVQDELEDIVGTVGQTFLGLTVNCGRCHDHKFDPISQTDYYRLAAALAGVRQGERDLKPAATLADLARARKRLEEIGQKLEEIEEPVRRKWIAEQDKNRKTEPVVRPIEEWDFQAEEGRQVVLKNGAVHERRVGLKGDGKLAFASSDPMAKPLREKTLEAWVRLDNLKQQGGGVLSVETLDGTVFDAIVFGEQELGRWMSGSNGFTRTRSFRGPAETTADRELVHVAITYHADGTIAAYRNGRPYGTPYRSDGPVDFKAGEYRVVFGLRHEPAGGNRHLAGTIARARLYNRSLSADEVAASAGVGVLPEADLVARLSEEQRKQRQQLQAETARLANEVVRLESATQGKIHAVTPIDPGVMHLLIRGEVTRPGPVVAPGGLSAVNKGADLGLKPEAPDAERRAALARWITSPTNPLFPRVIVNRLWHHHFDGGLVETPSDLGFSGGKPSHPELLDWLAAELIERKWSLKAMHRLIVTSATYRQSAKFDAAAFKVDAGNRLRWRRTPTRLEAEAVRDSILAVSGQLDRTVGGRGYQDFKSYFFKGTQFYDPIDQVGPTFARRTLYRMWARSGRNPVLDTFDCPDPSATAPRRAVTTTPLQALTLLNNAFVFDQADRLADRLRREAGDNLEKQLTRAYQLAYGRSPEAHELDRPKQFVQKHGLASFCRVLFNSNEFITVE
jgi:Protein of unknown function (DUF1553)/Protein of unknown function (DUF1549)/Concanavalin A-like lectin/glucanases superfamily/Planctomycete cytochrome C